MLVTPIFILSRADMTKRQSRGYGRVTLGSRRHPGEKPVVSDRCQFGVSVAAELERSVLRRFCAGLLPRSNKYVDAEEKDRGEAMDAQEGSASMASLVALR